MPKSPELHHPLDDKEQEPIIEYPEREISVAELRPDAVVHIMYSSWRSDSMNSLRSYEEDYAQYKGTLKEVHERWLKRGHSAPDDVPTSGISDLNQLAFWIDRGSSFYVSPEDIRSLKEVVGADINRAGDIIRNLRKKSGLPKYKMDMKELKPLE